MHPLKQYSAPDSIFLLQIDEQQSHEATGSFSLRLSLSGPACIRTSTQDFILAEDNVLLTCKQPMITTYSKKKQPLKIIRIDISRNSLAEAMELFEKQNMVSDISEFKQFFDFPDYPDHVYPLEELPCRNDLDELISRLHSDSVPVGFMHHDWFVGLAKKIIDHHYTMFLVLHKLTDFKKAITRKEILFKLLKSQQFIDDNFLYNPSVDEIAKHCNLSVYYFFRAFKQAFGITPYQYILKKKLQHAMSLINRNRYSLTEIAIASGFSDIFTFSKAFKKQVGSSPLKYEQIKAA